MNQPAKHQNLLISLLALFAVGIVASSIYFFPDSDNYDGNWALTHRARSALPIISALAQYKSQHGEYPDNALWLIPALPANTIDRQGIHIDQWQYETIPARKGYSLTNQISQTHYLSYRTTDYSTAWHYDPGNGNGERIIALTP